MSIGDSGIGTVGPTGEVKGWMVTGVNVSDHVGGTVGRAEGGTEGGAEGIDRQSGGAEEVDGESGESTGSVGEAEGGVDGESTGDCVCVCESVCAYTCMRMYKYTKTLI